MKIEKVNENQIRCIITHEDLENRKLSISEFTSGSGNVRRLIRDMMEKAATEFGFKTDNSPLMIEAMPISDKSVMILVTKGEEAKNKINNAPNINKPNNLPNMQEDFVPSKLNGLEIINTQDKQSLDEQSHKFFIFDSLDNAIYVSKLIASTYTGFSTLYKDTRGKYDEYILFMNRDIMDFNEFNRICNNIIEFAEQIPFSFKLLASFEEHLETLICSDAINILSTL